MKNRKSKYLFIFSIIVLLFPFPNYGQNTTIEYLDSLVTNFELDLKSKNIDTICIYKDYSVGSEILCLSAEDRCDYYDIFIPTYILWIKNGKTFLTKKDNCFDYSAAEINPDSLWYKIFLWKDKIKTEKVKSFEYVYFEKGKKKIEILMIDHSSHQNFRLYIGKDIIIKSFDSFDLQKTEYIDNEILKNINYQHNINLKSKQIVNELNKLMLDCETKKLLTKSRR